jgi:2-polyprenyl-6-methoxyphenol hydroxylase-like FAD-dependent oxidoreductase
VALERVVVIGAGIAGLASALALKNRNCELVLIERDPEPPDLSPEDAFEHWARPGVPQFRHAHMFLARLQTTLRDRHPQLLEELCAAGLELSKLDEILPAAHLGKLEPAPGDADLLHLWGRRPTFEYVVRRHVERLPGVRFLHSARVEGLYTERRDGKLHVRGAKVVRGGARELIEADLVIDASGKRSKSPEWLAALGIEVEVLRRPSDRVYVCRHYRLRDPQAGPPRAGTGANLDYFGYATFYAEHGHYAITLSCPVEEREFAKRMRDPVGFDAVVERLPMLSRWVSGSEVTSKVLGAGRFENRWTRYRGAGGPELLRFFAVGDSHIETNPIYGRGCASAFLQAEVLAEALAANQEPSRRADHYYARTRELMKTHFDFCVSGDDMLRSRGKLSRGEPIPLAHRLVKYGFDEAFTPAVEKSPLVAREMIKALQMREISSAWVRLSMLIHILAAWLVGRFRRRTLVAVEPDLERAVFREDARVGDAPATP